MCSTCVQRTVLQAAAIMAFVPAFARPALAHDGDIGVVNVNGRLSTLLVTGEPPDQVFGDPERVFAVEMLFSMDDNAVLTDEPHFATNDASVLGLSMNFTLTKAVRQWNNTLGVFEPTATTITVGNPALGLDNVTSPATDMAVAAATIPVFQAHNPLYLWMLDGATDTTGQGVFLVEGVFVNPSSALAPSEPLWLVFNYGMDESVHDAAVDYANANFVPAPSASCVLVLMGAAALRRRR